MREPQPNPPHFKDALRILLALIAAKPDRMPAALVDEAENAAWQLKHRADKRWNQEKQDDTAHKDTTYLNWLETQRFNGVLNGHTICGVIVTPGKTLRESISEMMDAE